MKNKRISILVIVFILLASINIIILPSSVIAGSYDGLDLAQAILAGS
jgi:hypothetical protein